MGAPENLHFNKFLGSDDVASQRPYFENHCSRGIGIDLRKLICNICYNVHKNHLHRVCYTSRFSKILGL